MLSAPRTDLATRESFAKWDLAIATFLAPKTPATRRAYEYSLTAFFGFVEKLPDEVTAADVAAFRAHLEGLGNSKRTVALRMTAVSSFYRFLCRPADAKGNALVASNPAQWIERPKTEPYENARKMRLDDFRKILEQIEGAADLASLRDRALLLCYVLTGRRRAEILNLRGQDLEEIDGGLLYRYRGKGGKTGKRQLPPPAAGAVQAYLTASGRQLGNLTDDSPIFLSIRGRTPGQPLNPDAVLRILKARAKRADIPGDRIKTHGLRHLAAELRRRAGATLEEVRDFLDHSNLATTSGYLQKIEGQSDESWEGAWAILTAA